MSVHFSLQDGTNNDQFCKSHILNIILKVTQHITRVGNSVRIAQPKIIHRVDSLKNHSRLKEQKRNNRSFTIILQGVATFPWKIKTI